MRERWHFKVRRQYADDCQWLAVNQNGLARDIRITPETALPQTVVHESDARTIRNIFLRGEIPSENRRNPEGSQKIALHLSAAQAQGIGLGKVAIRNTGGERSDGCKWRLMLAPIKVCVREKKLISIQRRHHP